MRGKTEGNIITKTIGNMNFILEQTNEYTYLGVKLGNSKIFVHQKSKPHRQVSQLWNIFNYRGQ